MARRPAADGRVSSRPWPEGKEPVVIDGGDRALVRLLFEVRARIAGLPAGTVIHLIAADPAAPIDLPAWRHRGPGSNRGKSNEPASDLR
jgi:hypothetical protein